MMIALLWYLRPCSLVWIATVYQTTRHRVSEDGNILMRRTAYGAYTEVIINAFWARRLTFLVVAYFKVIFCSWIDREEDHKKYQSE
jgi:hypothetical protein